MSLTLKVELSEISLDGRKIKTAKLADGHQMRVLKEEGLEGHDIVELPDEYIEVPETDLWETLEECEDSECRITKYEGGHILEYVLYRAKEVSLPKSILIGGWDVLYQYDKDGKELNKLYFPRKWVEVEILPQTCFAVYSREDGDDTGSFPAVLFIKDGCQRPYPSLIEPTVGK